MFLNQAACRIAFYKFNKVSGRWRVFDQNGLLDDGGVQGLRWFPVGARNFSIIGAIIGTVIGKDLRGGDEAQWRIAGANKLKRLTDVLAAHQTRL